MAFGERTTLNELFRMIRDLVAETRPEVAEIKPVYRDFRPGDVRHSLADIGKAQKMISYVPAFSVRKGLRCAAKWYCSSLQMKMKIFPLFPSLPSVKNDDSEGKN
jgi:UDP-N-acetylglucosamine/UDP-N-acetylgalactosamine 4-epimerase